jgi:hypothetical protein
VSSEISMESYRRYKIHVTIFLTEEMRAESEMWK